MTDPAQKHGSERPALSGMRPQTNRRYALRCSGREVPLYEGDTVLGRGVGCDVVLEDAMVSRQHARLHVTGGRMTLLDLGSRNGTLLNGSRVDGEITVEPTDQITIGSFVLEVVARARESGAASGSSTEILGTAAGLNSLHYPPAGEPDELTYTSAHGFELLASVLDKALVAGRSEEVNRLLVGHLERLVCDSEAGKRIPEETRQAVSSYALKLAQVTGEARWLELMFRLYAAEAALLPLEAVDALYRLPQLVRGVNRTILESYVVRVQRVSVGPAERFVSKRIEGLLQMAPG